MLFQLLTLAYTRNARSVPRAPTQLRSTRSKALSPKDFTLLVETEKNSRFLGVLDGSALSRNAIPDDSNYHGYIRTGHDSLSSNLQREIQFDHPKL